MVGLTKAEVSVDHWHDEDEPAFYQLINMWTGSIIIQKPSHLDKFHIIAA